MHASLERLRGRHEAQEDEGGFTLIELLIVIVILGILAGIVVFAVQNLASSSAQSACSADQKTVQIAIEAYKAQVGHYPNVGDSSVAEPGATPVVAATAGTPGVQDLYTTQSPGGVPVGPWLKTVPVNAGHYMIEVSQDGNGTITVANPATPTVATTCSAVG